MHRRVILFVAVVGVLSCAVFMRPPTSFVRAFEPGWSSIELRSGLAFDDAWQKTIDVLAKNYELEMIAKDGGYARTAWIYTWWKAGARTENYRVRVTVKFTPDRKAVDVKTEANYLLRGEWTVGYDTRLLETVKADIMGVVGRTTR